MNISCDWLCKLWSGKCSLSVVTCYWFTNGLFTKPHQIFMYKYVYTNFKELEFNRTQWAARRPGSIQQPSSSLSENNLVPVLWRWITWGGGGRRSGYPPPHTLRIICVSMKQSAGSNWDCEAVSVSGDGERETEAGKRRWAPLIFNTLPLVFVGVVSVFYSR